MPPVSVVPTVFVRIPLALGSSHGVGAPEGYYSFIVHKNLFPGLVKLGMDMIERDVLVLFLFLSSVSVGTVIFSLGIVLSFLPRARVVLLRRRGSRSFGVVQCSFSFFKPDSF